MEESVLRYCRDDCVTVCFMYVGKVTLGQRKRLRTKKMPETKLRTVLFFKNEGKNIPVFVCVCDCACE